MNNCVFCNIIAGSESATIVMRRYHTVLIEPLNPVVKGHVLVIPRKHVKDAYQDTEITGTAMADAMDWANKYSDPMYRSANIITSVGEPATQSVFHLHIHIVPRAFGDGLMLPWSVGDRDTTPFEM